MATKITEIALQNDEFDTNGGATGREAHRVDSDDIGTRSARRTTFFKVEGTLHLKDAELLERICRDVSLQTGRPVALDLNDLCFLDSESAAILCRMKREQGVILEGLNLFIKKVVELADESGKVRKDLLNR